MNTSELLIPGLEEFQSIIMQTLKLISAKKIVEIGVGRGILTEKLLYLAESQNGHLTCIDLYSWDEEKVDQLIQSSSNATFFKDLSLNVLPTLKAADAYIINGDHNYFTVLNELKQTWKLCQDAGKDFFAIVHGTCWPFARRDAYNNPGMLPQDAVHPHTWKEGVVPEYDATLPDGYRIETFAFASHEGGEHNGVLTAVWDFVEDKKGVLQTVNIPAFFGLQFIYSKETSWANKLTEILKAYKDHDITVHLEDSHNEILQAMALFQFERDIENLRHQNQHFDIDAFYKRMTNASGKLEGLGVVSIIIPTFNRPKLLKEAIKSALAQTYQDIEILVVNDAGQDVKEIISSFKDSRIVLIEHQENQGLSSARNSGLRKAKGKYIAYLDDDDLYYPRHIEMLVNAMHESGFKVAYTDTFRSFRKAEGDHFISYKTRLAKSFPVDLDEILIRNRLFPVCLCHEKECLEKTGLYDDTLDRHEDWEMCIRLAREYPFLHIPYAFSEYAVVPECTQMMTSWIGRFLNTALIIHNRYRELAKKNPNVEKAQIEFRDTLRFAALQQLEKMDDAKILNLKVPAIMQKIVENSLQGTKEDISGVKALLAYLQDRFPELLNLEG